jgi:hypothetical protein
MFESCWAHQLFLRNSASLNFSPISSASLTDK